MAGESAECYDRTAVLEKQDGIELAELLAPKKGMKVLDLGCGPGYHANLFAQKVGPEGTVTGVDPDEERIKIAKEKYHGNGYSLQYLHGNSDDFPAGNYDIIFSNHVIHWIEDKDTLFKRVRKNLRPGGRFAFVAVTDEEPIAVFLRQLLGEERSRAVLDAFKFVPQETYEALALANGLEMTHAVAATRPSFKFNNLDALLDYIEGIFHGKVTGLKSVDKDLLEKIKERHGEEPVMHQPNCCTFILTNPH